MGHQTTQHGEMQTRAAKRGNKAIDERIKTALEARTTQEEAQSAINTGLLFFFAALTAHVMEVKKNMFKTIAGLIIVYF